MSITEWFKAKNKYIPVEKSGTRLNIPDGIWSKCAACNEIIFQKEVVRNFKVCPKCNHHFKLTAEERVNLLLDDGSFVEFNGGMISNDPLDFEISKSYRVSLNQAQEISGLKEAIVTGEGKIDDRLIIFGVMDFRFIGGSMGSVVGEKVTRAIEKALEENLPLVLVCSSGGARMQEGMFSLMQMAKTSAAIARFKQKKNPYISILTNPTTGGVSASFATLADLIIAEPEALIGFAGPRVIEQTIKQKLPKGFQSAELMLKHGMIDLIVHRKDLKNTLSKLLNFLY
ncbi:MAG: acetyl-CoA carboxylase carboxyltransferase subunit beta [Actinobacteria bacterium]|nr:acetyl-CoA carboxylase carboxyltransferase subunit beta [Actinomycetota bacterium]